MFVRSGLRYLDFSANQDLCFTKMKYPIIEIKYMIIEMRYPVIEMKHTVIELNMLN